MEFWQAHEAKDLDPPEATTASSERMTEAETPLLSLQSWWKIANCNLVDSCNGVTGRNIPHIRQQSQSMSRLKGAVGYGKSQLMQSTKEMQEDSMNPV